MRVALALVLIITVAVSVAAQNGEQTPVVSNTPLRAEQIAIYRAFLASYNNGSRAPLNLANTTEPLDLSMFEMKEGKGCLKGIHLDHLQQARTIVHHTDQLAAVNLKGMNLAIVDAAKQREQIRGNDPSTVLHEQTKSVDDAVADAFRSGLFTFSEIAFSKDHRWAVLSFSFECGRLCGHGSVIVLQKIGEEWKVLERECGSWIS